MNKKYELIASDVAGLFRIRALRDFGDVKAGDVGGYVAGENNLSQYEDCWVYGDARVFGNAQVFGNARVYGNALVSENARVYGNAEVFENAEVFGNAMVYGNAEVFENAMVSGTAQVFGNARVSGDAQLYGNARVFGKANIHKQLNFVTRTDHYTFIYVDCFDGKKRILAGCRYFTKEEAIDHWTNGLRGGTKLGNESLKIVKFLTSLDD